jgi:tRNA threonylcarbamoyladenosine biosynthesis protein TsaB
VAWLGAAADSSIAAARPTYLRPPDAKPSRDVAPHRAEPAAS